MSKLTLKKIREKILVKIPLNKDQVILKSTIRKINEFIENKLWSRIVMKRLNFLLMILMILGGRRRFIMFLMLKICRDMGWLKKNYNNF